MKVLVLSHLYPSSLQPVYGTFVEEQVKELKNQGCEVKVIAPVKAAPFPINLLSSKWKTMSQISRKEEREGIEVYHPRYLSLPRNILFHQTGEYLYQTLRTLVQEIKSEFDFDLIHAHVALPSGYAARKLSQDYGVPYVVTIHGEDFFNKIHLNDKTREAIVTTLSEANRVLVVSHRLTRINDQHLHLPTDQFKVIHNGINDLFLTHNRKRNQEREKTLKIISVGRLIEKKGIQYNLKALSELKDKPFHYVIAGDGTYRSTLEEVTKELNLQDKVTFLGNVPPARVKELMDESDVFILTSWDEAFGVVYIEAMASGCVVIGSRGEGAEEIITDQQDGFLVQPKHMEEIMSVFQQLFENPYKLDAMGEKAIEKVKESFTWKKNVQVLIDEYQKIVNNQ